MSKITYGLTCDFCDQYFTAEREHARFCSDAHRVAWHRARAQRMNSGVELADGRGCSPFVIGAEPDAGALGRGRVRDAQCRAPRGRARECLRVRPGVDQRGEEAGRPVSTNDGLRFPEREAQREIWRAKKELLELTDPDREDAFDAERETCECMACAWRRRWGERERAEFAAFEAEHPDELKKLQRRRDWYLRVPRTWFPLDDLDERADARGTPASAFCAYSCERGSGLTSSRGRSSTWRSTSSAGGMSFSNARTLRTRPRQDRESRPPDLRPGNPVRHHGVQWRVLDPRMFEGWLRSPITALPLRVNHSMLAIERGGLVITNVGTCRMFATVKEPRAGLLTLAEIDDGPWADALLEDGRPATYGPGVDAGVRPQHRLRGDSRRDGVAV